MCFIFFEFFFFFFFLNDTASTEIYTLSLHDALPIYPACSTPTTSPVRVARPGSCGRWISAGRSEEHTSELQSHSDLVCRLLPEKKKGRCRQTPARTWTRTGLPTLNATRRL